MYQTPTRYLDAGAIVYAFEHSDLKNIIIARRHRDFTTIQLGNSADPSNNHREMLEWIAPLKEKKCRIYAPLSYHSKKHAQEVIHRGKAIFGDQFVALTECMPHEDFNRHLADMDIFITNHRRQQAFAFNSIAISLYLGTKLFVRSDVSTWPYLTERLGCRIFDTKQIPSFSWDELIATNEDIKAHNKTSVAHLFDRDYQRMMWQRIYDA